ncbi:MAG: right-handed parallel beta-helix repeat-containing protein [Lentisphaeria bacterium]|nr:right-handed parallel beta-helix repeat-containing protein [Lentisphaeria bacterium]
MRLRLTILMPGCLVFLAAAEARDWVVSPEGADGAPGDAVRPFRSVQAAVDAATPGDTIWVRQGVYRESVVRRLQAAATGQARITLAAWPGQRPVVSGADRLSGPWTPVRVALRRTAPDAGVVEEAFDPDAWRRRMGVDGAVDASPAPAVAGGLDHGSAPFLGIHACDHAGRAALVFADGRRLDQIGLQGPPERVERGGGFRYRREWDGRDVSDLRPGSFFHDREGSRLYLWLEDGSDPSVHEIEVSVRSPLVLLHGTWTLRGLDITRAADGQYSGGSESAVVVHGRGSTVEDCRIFDNEFIGLIHHGWDGVTRGCLIADNGLCGISPSFGWRMRIEGNEFRGNGWRGDVRCAHVGNKITSLKDTCILRNRFRGGHGLWLDINVNNVLVAENVFESCSFGVYFEISSWGVIANNVFRDCGRGIWVYGSNCLVAHNVLDRCAEGITISTYRRGAHFAQRHADPYRPLPERCLYTTRNNLVVNNILVDCTGSYLACGRDSAWGCNNHADWNVFAWTLPAIHYGGNHIKFMAGWDDYYGRLPFWWLAMHADQHSVIADALLFEAHRRGRSWNSVRPPTLVGEPRFVDRQAADYRLREDSPLIGRGIRLPLELLPPYVRPLDDQVRSRSLANTQASLGEAPADITGAFQGEHYRLQPLPFLQPLVDLDACVPGGTPGLHADWERTGIYPCFPDTGEPEWAPDGTWVLAPENRLRDPSFDGGLPANGPWEVTGPIHVHGATACLNLLPQHTGQALGRQVLGPIRPDTDYLLWAKVFVDAPRAAAEATIGLAASGSDSPLAEVRIAATAGQARQWRTWTVHWHSGPEGQDAAVGSALEVRFAGRLRPGAAPGPDPAAFIRWDDFFLLSGEPVPLPDASQSR